MSVAEKRDGTALTIVLEGRLVTTEAMEYEANLKTLLAGVEELTFDLAKLEHITSAWLRVLLTAQKIMNRQGTMKVIHVNDLILEIFETAGFDNVLTVE